MVSRRLLHRRFLKNVHTFCEEESHHQMGPLLTYDRTMHHLIKSSPSLFYCLSSHMKVQDHVRRNAFVRSSSFVLSHSLCIVLYKFSGIASSSSSLCLIFSHITSVFQPIDFSAVTTPHRAVPHACTSNHPNGS